MRNFFVYDLLLIILHEAGDGAWWFFSNFEVN